MSESFVTVSQTYGATSFVGEDATRLAAAIVLRSALKLYKTTGLIPTRGVTITKMLALAGRYSDKRYKRGQIEEAIKDVNTWIEAMKAAIPIIIGA